MGCSCNKGIKRTVSQSQVSRRTPSRPTRVVRRSTVGGSKTIRRVLERY